MLDEVVRFIAERAPSRLARDALDIFIVYYVCYRALLVLRGTRAVQVGFGLGAVFLLYLAAHQLQLASVLSILGALISSIILVIVVVFQNDIRRGLMRVGSTVPGLSRGREAKVIDEVVEAATELARHRTGAVIAFEQDANLDEFVGANKGHVLDATVTTELLVSLFIPEPMNKLHDGAVIIRSLRIAKAGVFFPMPASRVLDQSFGSRHRAALGITEETDAVVVVVSEERGTISYCFNGNIASNLDGPGLRRVLESIFTPKPRKSKQLAASSQRTARAAPAPVGEPESGSAGPVSEEITLPLRPDAELLAVAGQTESQQVEVEPAPDSRSPAPLRPRAIPTGDSGPISRSGTMPAVETRGTDSKPLPPLRPRPSADTDETRGTDSKPPPPLRPRPSADTDETRRTDSVPPPPLRPRPSADTDETRGTDSVPPPPLRPRPSASTDETRRTDSVPPPPLRPRPSADTDAPAAVKTTPLSATAPPDPNPKPKAPDRVPLTGRNPTPTSGMGGDATAPDSDRNRSSSS